MIWGMTFPVIRSALHPSTGTAAILNPYVFVAMRLLVGSLFLLLFVVKELRALTRPLIMAGLMLAFLAGAVYVTQTVGLHHNISSARSAFISGMSVVFVPLLQPLFKFKKPTLLELLCAAICLFGIYILTGAHLAGIGTGDLWTFACAFFYALSVLYLQVISPRFKDPVILTFLQISLAAPMVWLLTINQSFDGVFHPQAIIGILFCGIIASGLGLYLQVRYQKHTTAAKAAVIYALEPVFASFFGALLYGEGLSAHEIVGGSIILVSLVLPSLIALSKKTQPLS